LQIGCGGTGSYLVPPLYKYLSSISKFETINVVYYLIDHDVVEGKNCARQNFTVDMIGATKVNALKDRYEDPKHPIIQTYDTMVDEQYFDTIEDLLTSIRPTLNIVIGCVDTLDARKNIVTVINNVCKKELIDFNESSLWYIDSGNFIQSGQSLVLSYNDGIKSIIPNSMILNVELFNNDYAEKIDKEVPSCTENGDQSIFANFRAADIIYSIVTEILTRGTTTVSKVSFLRYHLDTIMDSAEQLKYGFV